MSIDVQRLLWQQLNKKYGNDTNKMFVMTIANHLSHSDYSPAKDLREAALNTFELVNYCIECNANYAPTGSKIAFQWQQLLFEGEGPQASPAQKPAFERAKALLYTDYEAREQTELYKQYCAAKAAFVEKRFAIKMECEQRYGNNWEANFEEIFPTTEEYKVFQPLKKKVSPLLQAIEEWEYGPLAPVMAPIRETFEDNERSAVLPDGCSTTYYHVSMNPPNWYQWLDPDHPDDGSWQTIAVDPHSDDDYQHMKYRKLGGIEGTSSNFISLLQPGGEEKTIDIGDSQDVKINLKVRSVQIDRSWIDLSALKLQEWKIPGEEPSSWSTGLLESSNSGSFPLLSTEMIVAKDITVTATKFSKEISNTLKAFNSSVDSAVLGGVFNCGTFNSGASKGYEIKYDEMTNSITLKGTQVIGYVCTLLPKYPA